MRTELSRITAATKCVSGPGDYNHRHIIVDAALFQCIDPRRQHRFINRIVYLRTIERDDGDAVIKVQRDGRGHCVSPASG